MRYESVTDDEALAAFRELSRLEGIIPALEPAHAIAWVLANPAAAAEAITLVTLSGRGDKDLAEVPFARWLTAASARRRDRRAFSAGSAPR